MTIAEQVKRRLECEPSQIDKNQALERAEKLADLFKDVRPVPYEFPIERALGLPQFSIRRKQSRLLILENSRMF